MFEYINSLSEKEKSLIVHTRPGALIDKYNQDPLTIAMGLIDKKSCDTAQDMNSEMIARKAVYGKDPDRLNLN